MIDFVPAVRRFAADGCYVGLTLAAWAGQTVLIALGLILALVLLATGCNGAILFSQLENLSSHYLSAPVEARTAFDAGASGVFVGLLTLLTLVRLPPLVERLRAELRRDPSHD